MRVLSELEPKNVFSFFEDICNIPHPSYKEKKISDYLVQFAKDRNLEYYQDDLYNVIIIKEATKGYEDVEPIILQGHMDMVCEKKPDCTKNMEEEGLDLAIDGDYVYAKGTTLGGDDGIAVAYALAILDDQSLSHPRLEFVCTVSEEVGMEGAAGIDVSPLKGKKLLNMDSENEGIMLASCAGGCSTLVKLPVSEAEVTGTKVSVALTGLTGGHSGVEIDKGRGNANVLMSRIIRDVAKVAPVSIVSMEGGKKDNAIPRDCTAEFVVAADKAEAVCQAVTKEVAEIKNELSTSDPEIKLAVETTENFAGKAVTEEDSKKAVALIQALPNGIMRMSQDIENLVETSLNLGILALENGELNLRYALRSSVGSAVESLRNQLECIAEAFGGSIEVSGAYPAWEYKKDSKLRDDMVRIFAEMYGKEPTVEAIHAGVECGLLSGKIPGLDCISMGPDMYDIHTSEERLSISSTKRMYEYVVNVIQCK
ncbi:MAG: aminoacyl-histidine dipeptidase [Lachnospiraceae bacterium]|nr:aminoacyl-histidine dipeptidase [Lachnospiraceae bacterium]MDD6191863.1 aminoacyl-histidine dipeptidase [Lachnospiraceae bacterium]MDY4793491.1 aminoacyl-histidine dipeptidase [Pararoseburia sp.]